MKNVTIPSNLDQAQSRLEDLDKLVSDLEWERAAIVSAFTGDAAGQHQTSAQSLSQKGISGLSDTGTITHYARAYQEVVGQTPRPGQSVQLPDGQSFTSSVSKL